jgi:hypothetical protein
MRDPSNSIENGIAPISGGETVQPDNSQKQPAFIRSREILLRITQKRQLAGI